MCAFKNGLHHKRGQKKTSSWVNRVNKERANEEQTYRNPNRLRENFEIDDCENVGSQWISNRDNYSTSDYRQILDDREQNQQKKRSNSNEQLEQQTNSKEQNGSETPLLL